MAMASGGRDAAGYIGWFLVGAVAGAVVALVTAPRTGRATREFLTDHGEDAAHRAQSWADQAQSQAGEWMDRGRELLEEQTERLMSAFEAGREAMQEEIRRWSTGARG
jgi:gas vesicle protein